MRGCCFMCRKRTLGCHGKDEDGNWLCEEWGKEKDRKEAERQYRREQYITNSYFADFRKEKLKKEQAHHAFKGKE